MIRVYQCKGKCCMVQRPGRRFWMVERAGVTVTVPSFAGALGLALYFAAQPLEVTA